MVEAFKSPFLTLLIDLKWPLPPPKGETSKWKADEKHTLEEGLLHKSEGERQIPCDNSCMWNLKYDNKWVYLGTETDSQTENRLVVTKGEGVGGSKDWEFGISRCKLSYIGWINNKILLYSIRNYFQYLGINHNGKEYYKEYICVCV